MNTIQNNTRLIILIFSYQNFYIHSWEVKIQFLFFAELCIDHKVKKAKSYKNNSTSFWCDWGCNKIFKKKMIKWFNDELTIIVLWRFYIMKNQQFCPRKLSLNVFIRWQVSYMTTDVITWVKKTWTVSLWSIFYIALKKQRKRASRICGSFIFGKTRPNLSPFFPTRFLLSLSIHLLIRFSFFLRNLFKGLFKFFKNLFDVFANLFQGFSKIYPKVEVQNFPNFPFFPFFLLKSKVKLIFKIEVGESGVDFKKFTVEVGVGSRFQKI